ncbi:TonB-dependent receptor [Microbulbifer pacificus]|uniref:TonB-dependent receptor n=1 Tax=Microbulbifer pacificus TaxID=407164 RepID=A0AAU0MX83_9GAMM|nr:TonB-dependent receptor [Microbulbifer pacificus]WOX05285.1 TonB-dependent receptor [Microbulbifer pacificus]
MAMNSKPNRISGSPVLRASALATAIAAAVPAVAQDGAGRQLEEVVVTAQRRAESMQDVPVAVTAATSEDLAMAQVDSVANIQQISSSIKFDVTNSAANSANIMIRGIGTVGNSRAFEGAVGVFVDGVYRTRAGQAMQNWLDIGGLEILRGPQGTLFGKNTSAGALILNSVAPTTDASELDYEVTAGNYGRQMVRGAANMPVTDELAVRIAGLWGQQDGFIKDPNGGDYNERSPRALKAQFLYEPSETFSAQLIADWSDESNNCCYGQIDVVDGPMQPFISNVLIPARGLQAPSDNFDDYEQVLSGDTDQDITDKGAVLKLRWELASGQTVNSVTGYRDWSISQWNMDADFSGANILIINESLNTEMLSQEFTLNGVFDSFGPFAGADYVAGVYYAKEDIAAHHELGWGDQAQTYFDVYLGAAGIPAGYADASAGIWSNIDMPADSTTFAAFTHWNLDVTEKFGLTVGARYSRDEKAGAMQRNYFSPAPTAVFRLLGVQPGPEYDDTFKDSAVSGTLAARYQIDDAMMAYASYSRGYKAGGVNIDNTAAGTLVNNPAEVPGAVPLDPTYKSEFVDGYELGLKSEYAGGRARTNVAVFYNEMSDLQIAQFIGTQFTIDNAPEATAYGVEVENQFLLSDAFSLNFDVTHIADASFGSDPVLGSLADREFAHAPKWAGNLALSVDQPLSGALSLFGRVGINYSTELYTNTSNDLMRGNQGEVAANIGVRSEASGWTLAAWCQNCSDERYVTQHFNSPLQGNDANGYVSAPRTYGVTLRGSF